MRIVTVALESDDYVINNIALIDKQIQDITIANNVDLIFFGELALSKYIISSENLTANAIEMDSPVWEELAKIPVKYNIAISVGYIEKEQDCFYNSQVFINRKGQVVNNHRKYNLTNSEKKLFKQGSSPLSFFEFEGLQFACSICFDMFASTFSSLWKQFDSIDVMLHSLTDPQDANFALGFSGRMVNSYYIASNRYGMIEETYYNGHIGLYSPYGKRLSISSDKVTNLSVDVIHKKRSKILMLITNNCLMFFHTIRYFKKVISYIKWAKQNESK